MATILIVDDEISIRRALATALIRAGHEITLARDGQEAVNLLSCNQPDLVITDMIMPVKDGAELLIELRRITPNIPTIVISGGGRINAAHYLKMAECLGAHEVLLKPFNQQQLLAAVEKVLETRRN